MIAKPIAAPCLQSRTIPVRLKQGLAGLFVLSSCSGLLMLGGDPPKPLTGPVAFAADDSPRRPLAPPRSWAQAAIAQGETLLINGTPVAIPWQRRGDRIGLADLPLMQALGVELRDTDHADVQPVQWFSDEATPLSAWHDQGYRYLDVTPWAAAQGWQLVASGNTVTLQPPAAQIITSRHGRHGGGDRWVLDVNRPALWRLEEAPGGFRLTVYASAAEAASLAAIAATEGQLGQLQIESTGETLVLRGEIPRDVRPRVWSLSNPDRIVIDLRQDSLVPRDILWAPGLRWQSRYVQLGERSFPVQLLRLDLTTAALQMQPIGANSSQVAGLAPLPALAQRQGAVAAINGGFFNRNNQLPLGALRQAGRWISGPILSRGAIAWDNQGNSLLGRLFLSHTLTTDTGRSFTAEPLNSGYVQAGIGLYTPAWGSTYTPILDNETLITVMQNQVQHQRASSPQAAAVPIPEEGYLLAVRAYQEAVQALTPGTQITLTSDLRPPVFAAFPHVVGGGPLLRQNGRLVLNAAAEGFSSGFANQAAPRSAIGRTSQNELMLVTIHPSPGGRGPTLQETAQVMAQLGNADALNLDGGNSTSLYLGGTLLNRLPATAGRVNNAIGIFLNTPPSANAVSLKQP